MWSEWWNNEEQDSERKNVVSFYFCFAYRLVLFDTQWNDWGKISLVCKQIHTTIKLFKKLFVCLFWLYTTVSRLCWRKLKWLQSCLICDDLAYSTHMRINMQAVSFSCAIYSRNTQDGVHSLIERKWHDWKYPKNNFPKCYAQCQASGKTTKNEHEKKRKKAYILYSL